MILGVKWFHVPRALRRPSYAVPALEKGLDILELLATEGTPMALAQLAPKLKRNRSELYRMCSCLEERGYIGRDAVSGKYVLTLRLFGLAHMHSPMESLLKAAHAPMQEFSEFAQESCHLSIVSGDALLVVAQTESPAKVRLSIEVGARFDLLTTASGRLLLAHLPEAERGEMIGRLPGMRGWSGRRRAEFERSLSRIAREGICVAENETRMGVRDVVVPVGRAEFGLLAALACSALLSGQHRRTREDILAAIRDAAAGIARRLGFGAPA